MLNAAIEFPYISASQLAGISFSSKRLVESLPSLLLFSREQRGMEEEGERSNFVVALIENRAKEVGVAAFDLKSASLYLSQFIETSSSYQNTMTLLYFYDPMVIIVPPNKLAPDGMVVVARSCFDDAKGAVLVKSLASNEPSALGLDSYHKQYYLCLAAASANIKWTEAERGVIVTNRSLSGDLHALDDPTYERRKEFLRKYKMPRELPVVTFHTGAGITPAVLASLSHVAHAELPMVPSLAAGSQPTKVPVIMPLGTAMAACAQLLRARYGEKSDGLVTRRDAEAPGSIVVRPDHKLDHAWMVYSSLNEDPREADASQVCEALLTLLVEVGLRKRHEIAMKGE